MATYSTTLKQFVVTNADFQAWYAVIRAILTAAGWAQTSDTGQVAYASMAIPGSNNTNAGYEIWRMDDALQATRPVYLKIYPGRGAGATFPRLAFEVAMGGTDGAGNFVTTFVSTQVALHFAASGTRTSSDTTAYKIYGSGSTNRLCAAFSLDPISSPYGAYFSIERTKNSDGTDNGDGVVAHLNHLRSTTIGSAGYTLNFIYSARGLYQQNWIDNSGSLGGFASMLAGRTWTPTERSYVDVSTLRDGKVWAFPTYPLVAGWKYPLMNQMYAFLGDFPQDYTTVSLTIYGAAHTYLPFGLNGGAGGAGGNVTHLMRYE